MVALAFLMKGDSRMTITDQVAFGESLEISRDRILIGRSSHCPICIPDAAQLQEEHACLRRIADRWIVESLGDWLIRVGNQAPAKFAWLKTADVIRLSQDGPELDFSNPLMKTLCLGRPKLPMQHLRCRRQR